MGRGRQPEPDRDEIGRIERQLSEVAAQERRLVKLFASGKVDEHLLLDELEDLKHQKATFEERLRDLQPAASPGPSIPDRDLFKRECQAVSDFLDKAGPAERALALEALQIAIRATPTEAVVHGVVPVDLRCIATRTIMSMCVTQ